MQNWFPLISFAVTVALLELLLRTRLLQHVRDIPNHRSLHVHPVPRTGGIALLAGAAVGFGFLNQPDILYLCLPVVLLVGVSFLDDSYGLLPKWRFLAHLIAAVLFVALGLPSVATLFFQILLVLAVTWMINLYNFMDGSDGLAGGMAVIGFSVYGLGGLLGGVHELAMVSFCIAAAAAGFLIYNFHPAKIFLGDAGSIPLGFLAAAIGLLGWEKGAWPLWFPALVFSPFLVDATLTLSKRLIRGERIWMAHKEHYYQLLVQVGFGHRRTALFEYILMLAVGISALWGCSRSTVEQYGILVIWGGVYWLLVISLKRLQFKLRPGALHHVQK